MESVYTIMRRMFKMGYTMTDTVDKIFIDKHNQKSIMKKNKGSVNEE
jgi:hypothetical protein